MKKFALIILVFLLAIFRVNSQNIGGWFTFDLRDLDTTASDFSPSFDVRPIAEDGYVSIDNDGHFSVKGEPIRFWGTPCNPFKEDYILPRESIHLLAKEYSKMGVNLVRLHLMDSKPFLGNNSIFGGNAGTRIIDPVQLDKIDYMISEFRKQGIYIMLDLLCDRKYEETDGVPDPDSVYTGAKEVNFFDPLLISLQKEYAQQLLTHVNPYTGIALKDEPALAMIDIVNEGWFLHSVRCDEIKPISDGGNLSHYHYSMLTDLWNDFIHEKYLTEDSLMRSWGIWPYLPGNLPNSGFESGFDNWEYGSFGSVVTEFGISGNEVHSGSSSFHLYTTTASPMSYECYLNRFFTSVPGKIQTLSFWAKTVGTNHIDIQINQDNQWIAGKSFELVGNWKRYTFSFISDSTLGVDSKIFINLGNVQGDLWMDDFEIGLGEEQLHDGGSFNAQNIRLLNIWENESEIIKQRKLDQSEFYLKVQTDHFTDMKDFLKNDLGVKIPITGSNYLVGIPDIYAQSFTDFIDNHGYWVYNESNPASQIIHPGYKNAMLTLFAGLRIPGKPLTASEYNYELANPSANEALFFLSAYGSLHEADMLLIHGYDYGLLNNGLLISSLDNYHRVFDKAMLPTFAYVYRNHLIDGAKQEIDVSFSKNDVYNLIFRDDEMWGTDAYPNNYPFKLMYQHGLRTDFNSGNPYQTGKYPSEPQNPFISDTQQIEWDSTGLLAINTPRFIAAVGKLNAFTGKAIGPVVLSGADKAGGLTLLTLDEKPVEISEKLLMTVSTQQLNDEMVVVGYEELDYGHAPLMLEAIEISFTLHSDWEGITIYWLDKHGNPTGHHEIFMKNQSDVIPVTINTYQNSGVWFGIEPVSSVPSIKLVSFHPDEYPYMREPFRICWNSHLVDTLDLFWTDGFTTQSIGTFDAGTGFADWIAPDAFCDKCSIIATSHLDPSISDTFSFPLQKFCTCELIKNGTFNEGMENWTFYPDNSPNEVTYTTTNNHLRVNIIQKPEQIWHYNLSQPDIFPDQGDYLLDFDLSIPTESFTRLSNHFANQNTWEFIGNSNESYLYRWEKEKHFQFPFRYNLNTSVPVMFNISLGGIDSVGIVDNIRLRKICNPKSVKVTFRVDMKYEQISASGVHLNGNFLNWSPNDAITMNPADQLYTVSLSLPAGAEIDYKFINGSGNDWSAYELLSGTCAWGNDKNRHLIVPESDTVLNQVCFSKCDRCSGSAIEEKPDEWLDLYPNPFSRTLFIKGLPEGVTRIEVYDALGHLQFQEISQNNNLFKMNLSDVQPGIYIIRLTHDKFHRVFKAVKSLE